MKNSTPITPSPDSYVPQQESFSRVAPLLKAALLLGVGGGFLLAAVLTFTSSLALSLGPWWLALAQAHGHLQLYGWAGLFVLGVALHFLPRLRGAPLAMPGLVPWLLGLLVASFLLRLLGQPLALITGARIWYAVLIVSAILECVALLGVICLLGLTVLHGPPLATRAAFRGILPFIICAFGSLGIASLMNLISILQPAAARGLVPDINDEINVSLGLLGFLVPMALAMSAQSLPMYSGLEPFPRRVLWPLATCYLLGLLLMCIGTSDTFPPIWTAGLGMVLIGGVILVFIAIFLRLMSARGRLPQQITRLAPEPDVAARSYKERIATERRNYGPFVALVASAYLWALLGGLLLISDGVFTLWGKGWFFPLDAIHHSFAIGFITLLICGIAPRMLAGFSGEKIVSPRLVHATFWLGNIAAGLRVGVVVLITLLGGKVSPQGQVVNLILFGLSGPIGLVLALCLAINLWPTLSARSRRRYNTQR